MLSNEPLYKLLPPLSENAALLHNVHPEEWKNPEPVPVYDFIVIGAGPTGIIAALTAATEGHRVAIIERDLSGGDCFNVGCIPSKTLIRASRLYADMRNAEAFGGQKPADIQLDFPCLMQHVRHMRTRVSKRVSVHRLTGANIDVFLGGAAFTGKHEVSVAGLSLKFKKALIATGSRPRIPPIPGLETSGYLTNETFFNLEQLPKTILIIGGGPLGCELGQALLRLGSQVSIAQRDPMFLGDIERDGAQLLSTMMAREGMDICLNAKITGITVDGINKHVELMTDDITRKLTVEQILVSAGRTPNIGALQLEQAGVAHDDNKGVSINDCLQTTNPDIYAAGDVCPDPKFDHVQDGAARIVVRNALDGESRLVSSLIMPWCIYTDPEVSHVGLQVREARERNIPIKTYTVMMHEVDRAIVDSEDCGFVKIHVREGTDEVLGATVAARHAGDFINYISLAMRGKLGLRNLADASFPYPTQAQAIKMAAVACELFLQSNSRKFT